MCACVCTCVRVRALVHLQHLQLRHTRPLCSAVLQAAAKSLREKVARYMETHWDEFPTVLEEER